MATISQEDLGRHYAKPITAALKPYHTKSASASITERVQDSLSALDAVKGAIAEISKSLDTIPIIADGQERLLTESEKQYIAGVAGETLGLAQPQLVYQSAKSASNQSHMQMVTYVAEMIRQLLDKKS